VEFFELNSEAAIPRPALGNGSTSGRKRGLQVEVGGGDCKLENSLNQKNVGLVNDLIYALDLSPDLRDFAVKHGHFCTQK
jgi:hypothetical protein